MKETINLLTIRPEREQKKQEKKIAAVFSFVLIGIFLIFNLALFGIYFFLRSNAEQTIKTLEDQEVFIVKLSPLVQSYSSLEQKLAFLSGVWQKQIKMDQDLTYLQSLFKPFSLERVTIDKIGQSQLNLFLKTSSDLEAFLEKLKFEEKNNRITNLKIISTNRNEDTHDAYELSLIFKLVKP